MYDGDDIDLLYVLGRHGWSDLVLWVGGEITQLRITHVFNDPLEELAQMAIDLRERMPQMAFILWDEPGGHRPEFNRVADQPHKYVVQIRSFPDGPPLPSDWSDDFILEFRVKADHLMKLIYFQLEKLARLTEEKSYREHREFSYQAFKRLKSRLET